MTNRNDDVQGYLFGVLPYDFRRPTLAKALSRVYRPGGSLWAPKVYGAGWTLNFAHRGAWVVVGATAALVLFASLVG